MKREIEEQLDATGFYVSTTVGVSMWPMLRNRRDRVIIRRVNEGETLSKFDLPLYRRPDGKYVLHRVIGVKDGYYVIRGDNTYRKERVPHEQVLGVMQEFYRGNRHVVAKSKGYQAYVRLWYILYPARFLVRNVKYVLWRIARKLGIKTRWKPYNYDY
ncbi:MAG: hypothetical protein E7637_02695 [Ruminococcaceae bacterium]|nr:hypothetical protein [Oscillospiraceae bacterium]